ncbi:MAG: DUF1674 domain-containing protein [Alphaproteobacteria bacterium]
MEKFVPSVTLIESKEMVPQEQNSPVALLSENTATILPDPTRYGDWERNGKCVDF